MKHIFLLRAFSIFVLVAVVASTEVMMKEGEDLQKGGNEVSEERSAVGMERLWELLLGGSKAWIARATSYSSLLTLNVANVLLLGIITIAFAYYFGGGIPLGRSLPSGEGESDLQQLTSSVKKAVSSLMPVVQEALRIYHRLEHSH